MVSKEMSAFKGMVMMLEGANNGEPFDTSKWDALFDTLNPSTLSLSATQDGKYEWQEQGPNLKVD